MQGRVAVAFRPLPAVWNFNSDSTNSPENKDFTMLFYSDSDNAAEPTEFYLAGVVSAVIPEKLPEWQKNEYMKPEIINPNFTENGVQEGNFLDSATLNGFFCDVSRTLTGIFAKTRAMANILTSHIKHISDIFTRLNSLEVTTAQIRDSMPVGTVIDYMGTSPTEDISLYYLACDGQTVPRNIELGDDDLVVHSFQDYFDWVDNHALYLREGDSEENYIYRTPNINGRVMLSAGANDTENFTVGDYGGEYNVLLTDTDTPPHRHYASSASSAGSSTQVRYITDANEVGNDKSLNGETLRTWDGTEITAENRTKHNNIQPFYTSQKYIKVKKIAFTQA